MPHQILHLYFQSVLGEKYGCSVVGFSGGQGEKDDKIIAVCTDDPEYRHYNDLNELSPHRVQEIRRFFEDCKLPVFSLLLFTDLEIFLLLSPWSS